MIKENDLFLKFIRFWFPLVLYSGIIFYASSIEKVQIPGQVLFSDKFIHIIAYMPFGFLFARAMYLSGHYKNEARILMAVSLFVAFAYGLSDEFHQSFVPGRYATLMDAVADGIGGFLGAGVFSDLH